MKFPWFKKNNRLVCIEFLQDGFAMAVNDLTGAPKGKLLLEYCQSGDADDATSALKAVIEKNGLQGALCRAVLPQGEYQLLLLEAPAVPDAEMREAVRWKIKDLITSPLEEVVYDTFLLPEDALRSNKKMLYVVVAARGKVEQVIATVAALDLRLTAIDIGELALRNITEVKQPDQTENRGIAIARLFAGSGVVSMYKGGNLYLSRQFQLAYDGGLFDDLPVEKLLLELQRSLDYYERQMGQVLPSILYLCGENITDDKINGGLSNGLNLPIQVLNLQAEIEFQAEDDVLMQTCIGAVGGAVAPMGA